MLVRIEVVVKDYTKVSVRVSEVKLEGTNYGL